MNNENSQVPPDSLATLAIHIPRLFEGIVQAAKRRRPYCGRATTGLVKLDSCTGGFSAGDLVIVGGRPGSGKTSLCFEIIRRSFNRESREEDEPPDSRDTPRMLFVTAGERADKVVERLMTSHAGVGLLKLRAGRMVEQEFRNLVQSADTLHNANILLLDGLYPSTSEVSSAIRHMVSARTDEVESDESTVRTPPVVFIDSVQQLSPVRERPNRHQELTETIREIRKAADDARCVVVATSPLNRFHRTRNHAWPVLSDLRESGALEDEADFVLLLDQCPREEDSLPNQEEDERWLIIAKNRNGPKIRLPMALNACGQFSEVGE